jgi:ABC-2 type transport system ATP-binding protein
MMDSLTVQGLSKSYPGFALRDVSFTLPAGQIMGLVGANGAGKTTIIKLILNLIRRDAGTVRVFGLDAVADEKAAKARIGFVHEEPRMVEDARLRDIASATAPFYPRWDAGRFNGLMAEFGLPPEKKLKALSHGMKMKFSLALALAHDADLLVFDEPTSGLDPVFRRELLERLSGVLQDEGKSVLFSTHITSDLESTADLITLVHEGRVVFSRPKHEIRDSWAVVKGGTELLDPKIRSRFSVLREHPHSVEALAADIEAVRPALPPGALVERATLEDILLFLEQEASHA